jgi:hypothetical protein
MACSGTALLFNLFRHVTKWTEANHSHKQGKLSECRLFLHNTLPHTATKTIHRNQGATRHPRRWNGTNGNGKEEDFCLGIIKNDLPQQNEIVSCAAVYLQILHSISSPLIQNRFWNCISVNGHNFQDYYLNFFKNITTCNVKFWCVFRFLSYFEWRHLRNGLSKASVL